MLNFSIILATLILREINSKVLKWSKWQFWGASEWPILISRKIWVIEKSWNYFTVFLFDCIKIPSKKFFNIFCCFLGSKHFIHSGLWRKKKASAIINFGKRKLEKFYNWFGPNFEKSQKYSPTRRNVYCTSWQRRSWKNFQWWQ